MHDENFRAVDVASEHRRDISRLGFWGHLEDLCEDRESSALSANSWDRLTETERADMLAADHVRPDPIKGLRWHSGGCSAYLREHFRLPPFLIATVIEQSLLHSLRELQTARSLLASEASVLASLPSPLPQTDRESPRLLMRGHDGDSQMLDVHDGAFWMWFYSYTEDAQTARSIRGFRLKWAVGIFATDPLIGGLLLSQYGRGIGRHPGHAGREIGDTERPRAGTARYILRTEFTTELLDGSTRTTDRDGEDCDLD